jgi:hypothetical protein
MLEFIYLSILPGTGTHAQLCDDQVAGRPVCEIVGVANGLFYRAKEGRYYQPHE